MKFTAIIFAPVLLAASLILSSAQAQQTEQRPTRVVLQKASVGATGREATMQTVEFAQGAAEVPHTHPGELIGYVLEGAFELDIAGKPKATHRAGDSFFVEGGRVHAGRNIAAGPTKLLVTVILEKGQPPSTPAK